MISTRLKKALAEKISTFCKHCVGDKLPFGQVQLPGYGAVAPGSCLVVGLCCALLSLSCSLRSAPLYCQHWKAAAATFCVQVPILNLSNASVFARGVATSRKCILRYGHYTHFHTRGAAASTQANERPAREYFSRRALQTQLDSASANRYFAELSCQPTGHQLMCAVQMTGMPWSAGHTRGKINAVFFYCEAAKN